MTINQANREEWDLFSFGSDGSSPIPTVPIPPDPIPPPPADVWPTNPAFGKESEWFLQSAGGVESLVRSSYVDHGPFVASTLPKPSGDEYSPRSGRYGGGCHCLTPAPREVQLPDGLGIREDCQRCKKFIRFSVWNGSDGNHPFRPVGQTPATVAVTPDSVPGPPAAARETTRQPAERPAEQPSLFSEPAVPAVQDFLKSTLDEFFKRE